MSHQGNMRDLKRAAEQMEHHAADYHPEIDFSEAPRDGSIRSYPWTECADPFVEQGKKFGNHGKK